MNKTPKEIVKNCKTKPLYIMIGRANLKSRHDKFHIQRDTRMSTDDIIIVSSVGILLYYVDSHNQSDFKEEYTHRNAKEFALNMKDKVFYKYNQAQINYGTDKAKEVVSLLQHETTVSLFILSAYLIVNIDKNAFPLLRFEREYFKSAIKEYEEWGQTSKKNYKRVRANRLVARNLYAMLNGNEELDTQTYERMQKFLNKRTDRGYIYTPKHN